jgi:beta-glucosidase-like glycosyl hydrolase
MKKIICLISLALSFSLLQAQTKVPYISTVNASNQWVDSVFKKLTRNEKIGQLFMVRAHTNLGQAYSDSVAKVIAKQHLGGVVFFQGGPKRQALLSNQYQSLSKKVPLMIAQDAEWGLGMRLDSTLSYPYQMTLGAIQNNNLIYKMGQMVAKDLKRLGVHINFSPVMDVNNNPRNPVINYRSFGENKYNVANKSIAYMKGMQDAGLFTTAKHFPGHGDTDVDSHYDLPLLSFSKQRLDSLEMYPFKQAIAAGLNGVMVAHMSIPALDNTKNLPSTLSKPIITNLLKNDLNFKGLIFSDAMDMKGVVKFFPNGEADVKAIIAGLDVIELSQDSEKAIHLVRKSIRKHQLSWDDIDQKVKRILAAKYWMNLHQYKAIDTTKLVEALNRAESKVLVQELTDAAVTVLKGSENFPIATDFVRKTAIISIGPKDPTTFSETIKRFFPDATLFIIPKDISLKELETVKTEIAKFGQVIMALHDTRLRPAGTLDYQNNLKLFIADMTKFNPITVVFANPYTLAGLPGIEQSKALVLGYQNSKEIQSSVARVILGKLNAKGKLPVTINAYYKFGAGEVK